jgi:selenocysteine lyase/cysteine desulfurase
MLYARNSAQKSLVSLGYYFNPSRTLLDKLGLAASNYELSQAIPHVVDYFGPDLRFAWKEIAAHEQDIADTLLSYLRSRTDITIYGESIADPSHRVPTISFVVKGYGSKEVVEKIEQASDFGFRWGMMYSNRLVKEVLGLNDEGVVRRGMVHYNTGEFMIDPLPPLERMH